MGDNELVAATCILLAMAGIVILHFSAAVPITSSLDNSMVGKEVMLRGLVLEKKIITTNVFLTIGNESVAFFSPDSLAPYSVLENQRVCAKGTVKLYRGELELIAESLESC